jgi:subtilisin family serine protease
MPSVRLSPSLALAGRVRVLAPFLAAVLFLGGCGDSTAPELSEPSTLLLVSGDLQSVRSGPAAAETPLVVRVVDPLGRGVPGVVLQWSASDPSGSASPPASTTDREGNAFTTWTLGRTAGTQTLRATTTRVPGASVVFRGENLVPQRIEIAGGDGQQVLNAPAPAPDSIAVRVLDAEGRPFPGVTVTWTASDPTATLSPATSATDASGVARARWTLGATPGVQFVTAAVPGVGGAGASGPTARIEGENVRLGISGGVTVDPLPGAALSPPAAGGAIAGVGGAPFGGVPGGASPPASRPFSSTFPAPPATRLIVQLRADPSWGMGGGASAEALGGAPLPGAPPGPGALPGPGSWAAVETALRGSLSRLAMSGVPVAAELSPALSAMRIEVPAGTSVSEMHALLAQDPRVAQVRVDELLYLRGDGVFLETPEIRGFGELLSGGAGVNVGGLANAESSGLPRRLPRNPLLLPTLWHYNAIDAPRAWATTVGSAEVLVAVVDDGIRFDHPGVAANLTADGYNFVGGGDLVGSPLPVCGGGFTSLIESGIGPDPTLPVAYNWTGECLQVQANGNHGLHVAGTIGAVGDDGVGIPGLNWSVRIRPVRVLNVLGFGSWFDVAQGVLYAAGLPASNGLGGTVTAPTRARIINMSLGGPGADPLLAAAVSAATAAGSLIVASAGNGSTRAPSYPAAFPEVLSVASVGADLQPASYTNMGNTVDLAAPGGDFRSLAGVYSTTWNFQTGTPNYAFYQGTSMAAPHVTGVGALVLAREPTLTGAQLRERLERTAVRLGPPGWDPRTGHGLVNAYNAVHNVSGLPRTPLVQIHDADTGARVALIRPAADGSFSATGLPEGRYWVFAGEEESGDGTFAAPGRRAGWFGAPGHPQPLTLSAAGVRTATTALHLGVPHEVRPNGAADAAHPLVVGSLVVGRITATQAASYFEVRIPERGLYRFETAGVLGTCGYGLEVDTVLTLFGANGAVLAENDDTEQVDSALCSEIRIELDPGPVRVRVRGWGSSQGSFALMVRREG